jgi:Tfp pilus assembly protein PilP
MKLTTGILAMAMVVSGTAATQAVAQNADAIDQARSTAKSLQQKQEVDTNKAASKPASGVPAPAVKPAIIPSSKPVAAVTAPAAKPASASADHNQLKHVNVVPNGDSIQVEISSSQTVTPRVSKLSSPARVVVELPETVVASAQNKIPVGSGGVKGVRIGMDGKTPPTTSVVVDLEKALAYEVTPGPAGKLVLTLHTDAAAPTVAKNSPAPAAKTPTAKAPAVKASAAAAPTQATAKPAPAPKVAVAIAPAAKPVPVAAKAEPKQQAKTVVAAKAPAAASVPAVAPAKTAEAPKTAKPEEKKPEEKKWAMNGKRDPFFSPVVQQNGSGCSTGKKCLEIGAINLRGVVKSDTGFIAVVTNNLNKAYFLRENDPVFNGYVVKITGDSVTFQETVQDKLGKPFTREIVKKIFTPAV